MNHRHITFKRADPAALAAFDPSTKTCTMNCGQALGDPRSKDECKLLCDDCIPTPARSSDASLVPLYKHLRHHLLMVELNGKTPTQADYQRFDNAVRESMK